ncbi:MAG TPA: glycerophosphodiester phosphodiesterase, partial [Hyphomicrobiaceae bacterium]|nr:glycerophosphodiester phosphodiesterase [Hyphomicrobiaceae bacterium]
FDLQGHRGTRGLAPENTLVAFERALAIGVTTLETDLAVTRDGVLVLSHDPVLNPAIVRGAGGRWLTTPGPAINTLTLAELKAFDVGRLDPASRYGRAFPEQKPADGTRIPTLAELFELVRRSGKAVRFNIETKLSPDRPAESPDPETFARLVVDAIRSGGVAGHATIQSFDWRTLLAARRLAPEIGTVCLTTSQTLQDGREGSRRVPSPWLAGLDPNHYGGSAPRLANIAGCDVWSPRYSELAPALVAEAHALRLKVVPWTVNDPADLARVIDMKVDGLITDYPDRARMIMTGKGIPLP